MMIDEYDYDDWWIWLWWLMNMTMMIYIYIYIVETKFWTKSYKWNEKKISTWDFNLVLSLVLCFYDFF